MRDGTDWVGQRQISGDGQVRPAGDLGRQDGLPVLDVSQYPGGHFAWDLGQPEQEIHSSPCLTKFPDCLCSALNASPSALDVLEVDETKWPAE
jgi:hypothetical protein